jgi:PAS domain S-box-containing protein
MGEIKSALFINVFAFFAVAYLSSTLSENLRKTGRELRDKQGELASLQAFNENIINSMRGGLCTTNLEGIVTLFNRSAGEITGFRQEKVLGMPVAKLFNFEEPVPGNPAALTPLRFEKTLRNAEGKEIHLGFTVSPLLAEYDRHLGYVYSFQDLTEIKDLEYRVRQKDRLAAIGQMAAVIAHEIRNPLTAIAGAFKLLQPEFSRDEEPQKLLENISLEIKRLYRIVTDFLTYSRPLKFAPRRLDLNRLTADTLQLVRVGGDALPQHSIQYTRDPDCPLECDVDPDLFKQMLLNLLSNALKAMPEGGAVTLELSEGEDGMARILVRDTGIGLSGEEQARLFEPFQSGFQIGTGLGLSIVAQIVQAHQGTIRVESERGKGAVFEVRLPRKVKEIPVKLELATHSGRSV